MSEAGTFSNHDTPARYGLPRDVQYCTRCVMSNQRPGSVKEFQNRPNAHKTIIMFDDEGICAPCHYAEVQENKIDWEERKSNLRSLCKKYRNRNDSSDCIVPDSGGAARVFTSHVLKDKYEMNPLTVTWAPHLWEQAETEWRLRQPIS